jgi:hypothetical protein
MASQVGDLDAVGSPDLIVFLPVGMVLCLELKRSAKENPTTEQWSWIKELAKRDQFVMVARSYREVVECIDAQMTPTVDLAKLNCNDLIRRRATLEFVLKLRQLL